MTKAAEPYRETDVLVIGAGFAGCSAAFAAAKSGLNVVMIASKEKVTESASYYAQGGIIYRAIDEEYQVFLNDFQRTGVGIVNKKAVKQVYKYGAEFFDEVLVDSLNVPFDRTEEKKLRLTREASHSKSRIAHVKDHTGKAIQECFYKKIKNNPNIEILTNTTAIDLITLAHHSLEYSHIYEPSTCSGAYIFFQNSGEVHPIIAKQTILATGGLGCLYLHTSNPNHARGDGFAMAYRAGARIMNMEYIQFHPTTLFSRHGERFLITEAMRGEGAVLRNKHGEDFMKSKHELGSLAPRDIVSRCIMEEMSRTETMFVYLDITHKKADWIKERFPMIYEKCLEVKIDITKEGIPVVPAAHYECGGVAVDDFGSTTIRRLKAVGEVACTGLHGANRLASSSLLECLVYGTLAGRNCKEFIENNDIIIPKVGGWKSENEAIDADLLRQDWATIRQTMWNYVGIVRTAKKLERANRILSGLYHGIEQFYAKSKLSDDLIGLRNGASSALLVLHAAKLNSKRRGCHYRID